MKTWLDFHSLYLNDIPDCTFFAAATEIRAAAREFCSRSRAWRVRLDDVTTQADQSAYDFDRTNEMELVQLLTAEMDGVPLAILPDDVPSTARGLLVLSPRSFELRPAPGSNSVLKLKAAMQPSMAALGLDDVLFSMFADDIATGAKARLYAKDGKPYSNPAKAATLNERFNERIAQAVVKVARAHSSAALRTRPSFM